MAPDQEQPNRDPEAWKPVVMGQLSGGLIPPHPEPPEADEDELTRAALEDPAAQAGHPADAPPTVWRLVFIILVAVAALSIVFRLAR
ncbi:hypothetical protein [Mesoterricola sediminis]|uniref:Uncharacterized protein n=1 Tax=Mesoterricola sediminis TaxID=2927980 RepID=A0AA48H2R2_9BACT|nr:hypothetical protein [Mesoterricola sediminis]BDU78885.1 hypothetical protein METESE_38430 [Mesoterricola sediminis]